MRNFPRKDESVAVGRSPMSRRRRFARDLQQLREDSGLKGKIMAARLGWSTGRLSRFETGAIRPEIGLVMDYLDQLDIRGAQRDALIETARLVNQGGWWTAISGAPGRTASLAETESEASAIREFAIAFVPGLLQTETYARIRLADNVAYTPYDIDAAVQARQQRQVILTRPAEPVAYQAIIDEAVLRRRSAPPDILAAQLRHLIEVAARPNITVRVLTFDAPLDFQSTAMNSFALYRTEDDPEFALVETETNEAQLGDDEDVTRYQAIYERMSKAALDPAASIRFFKALVTS